MVFYFKWKKLDETKLVTFPEKAVDVMETFKKEHINFKNQLSEHIKDTTSQLSSVIQEIEAGEKESDYKLINVPPLIWSSFQCISSESAIVCNCASILHDPAEVDLLAIENDKIGYNW